MPYHFWKKIGSFGHSGTLTALLPSSKESLVNFKNKNFSPTIEAFSTPYLKVRQFENDRKLCAQSNVGFDLSRLKIASCLNVALDNTLT